VINVTEAVVMNKDENENENRDGIGEEIET
jgi:hypothetical protein